MSSNCRETADYNFTWGYADYKWANIPIPNSLDSSVRLLVHYFKKYLEGLGSTFMLEIFSGLQKLPAEILNVKILVE